MSREGDAMRRSLKKLVVPALNALGFKGARSSFVRIEADDLDLLTIQYGKYGGEFILEFARTVYRDPETGTVVPEEKMDVINLSPTLRGRLEQRGVGVSVFKGFSFAGFGNDASRYDALAAQVAGLLPQVDDWLRTRTIGSHIRASAV